MKNQEKWENSKFVYRKKKLRASRNTKEMRIASRLVADLVAGFYDRSFPKYASGILLDLGCGKVPFYEAYKPYIKNNVCVDWENSLHENDFLDHYADLNLPLPLDSGVFNTIILSDVLEHIKEPKRLWDEMNRVLMDGGILLMNVPFYYWLHEEPYDYYRYTKYSLMAMAEESNFEVVELTPVGGAPEVLADLLAKTLKGLPLVGKLSAIFIQKIVWIFIQTSVGNRISKSTAEKFPLGYTMIAKKRKS